ncbi:MAG: acyl-CoA thioesterase [Anaerolineae bacterium]|nr:acyl-CoA thioesterase [Anaerolineae bacterium]
MIDNTQPFHETSIRVRFAETDAMGIVHHANYLPYFEVGRVELIRQAGVPYADLEADGYSLAVGEVQLRYLAPAHFDQMLTVRTQVTNVRSRGVTFVYEIADTATGHILVTGFSKLICIDHHGAVRRIPEHWLEAMRAFVAPD